MADPFGLGVNYWPRKKAMYWWHNFDAGEVRDDFTLIKSLGMRLIRIFLLWEDWQPTPNTVSEENLKNLEMVCNIAADLGLKLDVTFFVGHMSGPNWVPPWMLDPAAPYPARNRRQIVSGNVISMDSGYRNMFHDTDTLRAEMLLIQMVVNRLKNHPAIGIWNLGNEPDLFAWPDNHILGMEWVQKMVRLIKEIDPLHPVTCGLHIESLQQDNGLRVHEVFRETDIAVMHGYPMYSDWSDGPLDTNFVPFICWLTSALSGKPTLMEEWGGPTSPMGQPSQVWEWDAYGRHMTQYMASEEDFARYVKNVLQKLVDVGATGAMMWCFADYVPELYGRPPLDESRHERHFGLVRADGTLKPHAEVIRAFAENNSRVKHVLPPMKLDITPEEYYENPMHHLKRLYAQFTKRITP